ncbi:MAG: polysaccharide deacetylase family protein [Pseudonocardiaceae bacterium]|nr:polysaccharide deacetylase family protein [Pseudonocardiaceae bacterium]
MTQRIDPARTSGLGAIAGPVPFVLMYHSVAPYREDPYLVTVDPARFARQLDWLRRRGLRGTSMRELLAARRAGTGRDLVGLTFDDGYADFAEYALPALRRRGFGATLFVIAGRLGGQNDWDAEGPRKPLLTANAVREIADSGIEIGSHGLTHVSLPQADDAELIEEIARSRWLLRDVTGQPVDGFCYPYGQVTEREVRATGVAGYDYGCAIWPSEPASRHSLPRTYVGDADFPLRLRAKHLRHRWICRRRIGPRR